MSFKFLRHTCTCIYSHLHPLPTTLKNRAWDSSFLCNGQHTIPRLRRLRVQQVRFFCASWKVHTPRCKFLLASIDRSRVETWPVLPQTCGKAMGQHIAGTCGNRRPARCPWPQVPGLETPGLCLLSSPGDPVCCHRPAAVPSLFQKESVNENFASLATVQGCLKVCESSCQEFV